MTVNQNFILSYVLDVLCGEEVAADVARHIVYDLHASLRPMPEVVIIPSGFFKEGVYGTSDSLPLLPLVQIEGTPLLFGSSRVERQVGPEGFFRLIVHADIIASAYFLLTRYEEIIRRKVRDEHGRFPGKESLPFRAGFLSRPIVDEYAMLLRKWAKEIGVEIPTPKRRLSVLLTHDVDSLGPERGLIPATRSIVSGLLGRRPLRRAFSDAAVNIGIRRHPYDNLDEIIKMDHRLTDSLTPDRCRSLYFFMSGGDSPQDGQYQLRHARTLSRLREVADSGAGIGLHSSYSAGIDPTRVSRERQTLQAAAGIPISKNRHHFLNWREPEDGGVIANAGISWDSTLSYADVAGFRLGVCHPVPLFDPVRQCLLGIKEHPLIVMDCTLSEAKYMNLDEEAAFECIRTLVDATFRHQGEFVCLWHNTVLADTDMSYHKRLYPRILSYLAELLEKS